MCEKSNNIRQDHIWVSKNTDNLQVFFLLQDIKKKEAAARAVIFSLRKLDGKLVLLFHLNQKRAINFELPVHKLWR